jgi:hypothetical protein
MAEAHGRLDFAVNLEIGETIGAAAGAAPSEVDVTAQVQMGSPYSVGRISFSGHRTINDSTLRRMIGLNERDRFDVGKLRRSLAGLSRAGRFEPLSPDAIEIRKDPNILAADLTIALEERPRGQWSISNPVAPLTGALQATVSSRLPAWGQGILEASTYYVTVGAIAPWNPLVRFLPIASKRSPWSWIALDRPWLPGQGPLSGFSLSPMLSARTMLARYGLTHASRGARAVLASGDPGVTLVIPVSMPTPGADDGESRDARFLLCEPPQPRLRWLRAGAAYIADLALGALLP